MGPFKKEIIEHQKNNNLFFANDQEKYFKNFIKPIFSIDNPLENPDFKNRTLVE